MRRVWTVAQQGGLEILTGMKRLTQKQDIPLEAIAIRLEETTSSRLKPISLGGHPSYTLEATAVRLEAITSRLEAITIFQEAMAIRLEAIATRLEAIAARLEAIIAIRLVAVRLEAIAVRLEAIANWVGGHPC